MYRELKIKNFKSIVDMTVPLGRVNVFIGANGSGKTNMLEAIAMLSAAKALQLTPQALVNKGVRVAKPNLTVSSFLGLKRKSSIDIKLTSDTSDTIKSRLRCNEPENIYAQWIDEVAIEEREDFELIYAMFNDPEKIIRAGAHFVGDNVSKKDLKDIVSKEGDAIRRTANSLTHAIFMQEQARKYNLITPYLIYNTETNKLRGIGSGESYMRPLGIYGEGLDVLLSTFKQEQLDIINQYKLIDWMREFVLDREDALKFKGHKLGRSVSRLYFKDKFMSQKNNVFSAENVNEGALHAIFYMALLISDLTPNLIAIDNFDSTLNPRLCESMMKAVVELSKDKHQVLLTVHNPAVLDGLDLKDDEQRLFVVKRNLKGHTIVDRVKIKPSSSKKYRLSQLFIEDYMGGLNPLM